MPDALGNIEAGDRDAVQAAVIIGLCRAAADCRQFGTPGNPSPVHLLAAKILEDVAAAVRIELRTGEGGVQVVTLIGQRIAAEVGRPSPN